LTVFERPEYDRRLAAVRARMAGQGIDTLLVFDPANLNYLTGYDGWSFYTPQGAVIGSEGSPLLFTRLMDRNGARVTTWLQDDDILGFPDNFVQAPDRHPMDWVCPQLRERNAVRGTVGLEMDSYYFTARAYEALRHAWPNTEFVDARELVNWVRAVKAPAELEIMREAAQITERVMRAGIDAVEVGRRQCDAVAAVYAAQAGGMPSFGGDYTAFVPLMPSGPGTSTPHLTWTDAPFVTDAPTILELCGARLHYQVPMARTVYLGTPPQRLTDTADIVLEGLHAALAAVAPGATCEEVEAAWRAVIHRHGLAKESRIGYSIGVGYPPDWGEHTMSLRPGDTTPLQENMCFHMILGIWMDDWGYELSEPFRVTASGAECFCRLPQRLFVKQ
jgi:ectoine hydrolase